MKYTSLCQPGRQRGNGSHHPSAVEPAPCWPEHAEPSSHQHVDVTGVISSFSHTSSQRSTSKTTPFLPYRTCNLCKGSPSPWLKSLTVNSVCLRHRKLLMLPRNNTSQPLKNTAIPRQSLDFHAGIWGWHTSGDTTHLVTAHAMRHIKTNFSLSLEDFKEQRWKKLSQPLKWPFKVYSSTHKASVQQTPFSLRARDQCFTEHSTSSPLIFFNLHCPPPPPTTRLPAQNRGTSLERASVMTNFKDKQLLWLLLACDVFLSSTGKKKAYPLLEKQLFNQINRSQKGIIVSLFKNDSRELMQHIIWIHANVENLFCNSSYEQIPLKSTHVFLHAPKAAQLSVRDQKTRVLSAWCQHLMTEAAFPN